MTDDKPSVVWSDKDIEQQAETLVVAVRRAHRKTNAVAIAVKTLKQLRTDAMHAADSYKQERDIYREGLRKHGEMLEKAAALPKPLHAPTTLADRALLNQVQIRQIENQAETISEQTKEIERLKAQVEFRNKEILMLRGQSVQDRVAAWDKALGEKNTGTALDIYTDEDLRKTVAELHDALAQMHPDEAEDHIFSVLKTMRNDLASDISYYEQRRQEFAQKVQESKSALSAASDEIRRLNQELEEAYRHYDELEKTNKHNLAEAIRFSNALNDATIQIEELKAAKPSDDRWGFVVGEDLRATGPSHPPIVVNVNIRLEADGKEMFGDGN